MSFGSDVSTFLATAEDPGLDPSLNLQTGERVVLEAVARRYMTPHGFLGSLGEEWEDYGFDLRKFLSAKMTPPQRAALISGAQQEAMKDERVSNATVTVEGPDFALGRMIVRCRLETEQGDLDLVLSVSAVTVEILKGNG